MTSTLSLAGFACLACSVGINACSSGGGSPPLQMETSGTMTSGSTGGATGTSSGTSSGAGATSGTLATSGTTVTSGSGATSGAGATSGTVVTSGTSGSTSGGASGSGTGTSGATSGTQSGSGATSGTNAGSGTSLNDGGPITLPDGSVNDVPAGYAGMPFMGKKGVIPGTIYARNYDTGGAGVAFNHPGGITCGDWPGGMAMYRLGADCVGLSVENNGKPDVTLDGGPANYGEIYISYCSPGEWLKYTVEVAESGTYAIAINEGGPNVSVSFSFSATPVVATPTLMLPASVDQAQPGHEMYHVWQTVNTSGTVTLEAGVYVMQFTIVTSNANFDSFTFTKM